MGHIHAELMKQYAEDATKSKTPWKNWEFTRKSCHKWFTLSANPEWTEDCEYRRKPNRKFIELNGKKFEIFTEKPENNTDYWCVDVLRSIYIHHYTYNSMFDEDNFNINNCFKDAKTAENFANELRKIFNNVVES